jgi:hypothetical protein
MAKAIAKKDEESILALFGDAKPDFVKDGDRGNEGVGADDISIPRLGLIQSLSPQRKKNDPAYIEGAEEGLLFNTTTGELYGDHVFFVPLYYVKEYLIWKDRDAGGGFRGSYPDQLTANTAMKGLEDGDQCEAIETAQQYGLIVDPTTGETSEIVLSLSRSQLKVSRKLNTLVRMNEGDRFSRVYRISSEEASGAKGDYYSFTVSNVGYVTEQIYKQAESVYEAITSGARSVSYEDGQGEKVVEGTEEY